MTGETEVVGQVRRAFERAQEEGTCGPVLSALFRHALQTGKRVRTETGISQGTTSFAYAAVTVARGEDPAGLRGARVVVVGAGEMGLGVCRALCGHPAGRRAAAASWWSTARSNARERPGAPGRRQATLRDAGGAPRRRVPAELADADVVLTAVAAESHVLARGRLRRRAPARSSSIDLGVPRNVDPAVGALDGVTLLDMDTLARVGGPGAGRPRRRSRWRRTAIVADEVERYPHAPAASAGRRRSSRRCGPASSRCGSPSSSATGRSWPT